MCCADDAGTSSVMSVGWTSGGGVGVCSSSELESKLI
jgi:hypothetical protein